MNNERLFAAVTAKARVIRGNMLTNDDYTALLSKNSIPAVIAYLKGTNRYKDEFASINELQAHRGQIEETLAKSVFVTYARLKNFIPVKSRDDFRDFMIRRTERDVIANIIMFISIGQYDSAITYLPAYLSAYISFDVMKLGGVKSFAELLRSLENTRYPKILQDDLLREKPDIEHALFSLYTDYYTTMFDLTKKSLSGKSREELSSVLLAQIELDNLLTAHRLRSLFNEPAENIKRRTFPFYSGLSVKAYDKLLSSAGAADQILTILRTRYFKDTVYFEADNLEVAAHTYFRNYFGKQLRLTRSSTMSLYALVYLLECEQRNIVTIIEGIRYHLPASEISKLLIR